MQPGVYDDIPNADYHGGPGVSKSMLDVLAERSPLHLYDLLTSEEERESTPAQITGTAFHALILEPSEFAKTYCLALRPQDVPGVIETRDQLVAMVEIINAEREMMMEGAVNGADELKAMIAKLNETRLPKLPTGGGKDELVARIIEVQQAEFAAGTIDAVQMHERDELAAMKGAELKAMLERINESRHGLLSTSGTSAQLAAILREAGQDFITRQEVLDEWMAEHGTPMFLNPNDSMAGMAEALRANGRQITLWTDAKAQWMANNAHRIVLEPDQFEQLQNMRDAVMAHPAARALLTAVPGRAEQSVYWIDSKTGMACRCRPDYWRADGLIVDVKTTDDASPEGFARSLANWRYHVQHAFYVDGVAEALAQAERPDWLRSNDVRGFVFLAVEKSARVVNGQAKGVAVYVLESDSVELGRMLYRNALDLYAQCRITDCWPGYGDKIQPIKLPAFEFTKHAHLLGAA